MNRILAKEFLLLVGCLVFILLVAIFGWGRNAWLGYKKQSLERNLIIQTDSLENLIHRATPRHFDFLSLFEPEHVRNHYGTFVQAPAWHCDLEANTSFSRVFIATFTKVLRQNDYLNESLTARLSAMTQLAKPRTLAELADGRPSESYKGELFSAYAYLNSAREHKKAPPLVGDISDGYSFLGGDPGEEKNWKFLGKANGLSIERRLGVASHYAPEIRDNAMMLDRMQDIREVTWDELVIGLTVAVSDSAVDTSNMLFASCIIHEHGDHPELRASHSYLKSRSVLKCTFEELLYTLQREPVPPTRKILDAVATQKTIVDELGASLNVTNASLWSQATQRKFVKWTALVLFVLVYPFRLLVIGTRLAIQVLKS